MRTLTLERTAAPVGTRRLVGWPLYAAMAGFPIAWAIGFSAFVWPVLAVPMVLALLANGPIRFPRGLAVWLLFLAWMLASVLRLDDIQRTYVFAYRASLYFSATVFFLYVYNMPRSLLPERRVVATITALWGFVVVGGFLGVVNPHGSIHTVMEKILPQRFIGNQWVYDLVHIRFAQIQVLVDKPVTRPSAPFPYANDWGSAYAVLIPFAILAAGTLRRPSHRQAVRVLLVLSIIPLILSANRGAWLSVSAGVLYAAGRFALRGRPRAMIGALTLAGLAVVLIFTTPLGDAFNARLYHAQSNESRSSLAQEATESTLKSPLFGYGAPRPSQENPNLPSVGTHGQLWLILFSHGIPGAFLFISWFIITLWRTRRSESLVVFWMNVVVFIAVFQTAYYTLLPPQIHVVMVAAALAWRDHDLAPEERGALHWAAPPGAAQLS